MTTSLFNPQLAEKPKNERRKSITLTPSQLTRFNKFKQIMGRAYYLQGAEPLTDAALFDAIIEESLDKLIEQANKHLTKVEKSQPVKK